MYFSDGATGTDVYAGFIQYNHSNDAMQFATNGGSEAMRISSSGQLLSGTTSGTVYYNSVNTYNASAVIKTNLSNEVADLVITNANNDFGSSVDFARTNSAGNDVRYATISAAPTNNTAGSEAGVIRFYTKDTSDSNVVERMRLTSTGLGIQTSSPSALLQVEAADGTAGGAIKYTSSGVASGYMSADAAGLCLATDTAGITFRTGITGNDPTDTGSERMRIDSSGNLLHGKTVQSIGTVGVTLVNGQITATADGADAIRLNRKTSDGSIIDLRKDSTTVGSLGTTSGVLTIDGEGANTCGFYFNGASNILPRKNKAFADGQVDLGSTTQRFDDIYATNGTIQTSDRNEKQDIEEITDAEQRVAVAAKGLLRKFRWKDAVAEKGDEARTHFGIIAQDLQAAFAAEGLDASDYAMFISSTWTDEETGEEKKELEWA
jgi:hypothetical protein